MSVTVRRLIAVLLTAAATAAVWATVLRGDMDGGGEHDRPRGVSAPVAALVDDLDPSQRIDQVLLRGFESTEASEAIVDQLRRRDLGGVLLDSGNFAGPGQLRALVRILRSVGLEAPDPGGQRIPPLIIASQEGGPYRAFGALPPAESQLEIGDEGSIQGAERWAHETGEALRRAGIDLNLFPVADVATLDSPIADRSFSDDPTLAAALTAAAIRGCAAAGIACAPGHFPGLGGASQDTDEGPATVSLGIAELEARDLESFRAALAERIDAIVLSHAFYAAFDAVTPASLAEPIATGLLRDDLGFDGVAITDDLGAGAITATYEVPDAAVAALRAGADLLRIDAPPDQAGVREALLEAVTSGEVPERRLLEAAGRVIELKRSLGLLELE